MRKVFWSFFSKKDCFLLFFLASCTHYTALPLPSSAPLAAALPGGPFSVREVEMLAVARNPDLAAAGAQRGGAGAQVVQARLLANPVVSGAVLPLAAGIGSTTAWNAGLSYDIRSLITRRSRVAASVANAQAVDAGVLWQAWQTIAQARLLCVDIIEGDRLLAVLRQNRDLLAGRADASRVAMRRGDATLATTAPDVAAVQAARGAVYDQERVQLGRRHQLNALLGLVPDAMVVLRDDPDVPVPSPAAILAGLPELPQRRPDLAALRFGYAAEDARLRTAILEQFPNFAFGVTGSSDNSNVRNVGPQVSLDLPVFDRNQGKIALERATRAQLRAEYAARLAAAVGQVQAGLTELALLDRQLAEARRELPGLARDALAAQTALAASNLDERSALDLITSRLGKEQQIVNLEQALLEQRVALATLTGAGLPAMQVSP